jgi:hypothetical protein
MVRPDPFWLYSLRKKRSDAVILSAAKDLCICLKIQIQGSFAALRMTVNGLRMTALEGFSAACEALAQEKRGWELHISALSRGEKTRP